MKNKIIKSKGAKSITQQWPDVIDSSIAEMTEDILWKKTNILSAKNLDLHKRTLRKISEIKKERDNDWYIEYDSYVINQIWRQFYDLLKGIDDLIIRKEDIELTSVDKKKFDADLCIKIPQLLQKIKWQWYIKEIVPKILESLNNSDLKINWVISKIEAVGIYVNITLSDNYLFNTLRDVFEKWEKYWENDSHKWESILVDYSSPNVAKHLHAWHIRSTIIGHILSNLYNANWYCTHRINHINDWWGFWYLIEGFDRWAYRLNDFENKNDMLFFIYTMYRKWEKVLKSQEEYNNLSKYCKKELIEYYGEFFNYEDFCLLFNDFVEASKNRFKSLERGENQETETWCQMVGWSMDDFNNFYNLLWIHQDYLIWESFYSEYGYNLVMNLEKEWKVVLYNDELANRDISKLEKLLVEKKITQKSFDITKEEILRDIWAYVIELENFERFVVLKWDKSSIYATRDLWAIKYRAENFSPTRIIYEVWQEQDEHFNKLFRSAHKIWIDWINFSHAYHWFYVDSKSKKKLSSRDWASSVQKLINDSIVFFKNKYLDTNITEEEINDIAYKLAIWSIIFNDIKSDKKNSISISSNTRETCESFEESWWAYILYSIIRAKSILAKIDKIENINFDNINVEKLDNIEKNIINEINRYPLVITHAQKNDNPSILAEFILNLSRHYNSYYNSHRVIYGKEVIESRIIITKAFIGVASNAMKLFHIKIPNKI